jgi:hypothetical protein
VRSVFKIGKPIVVIRKQHNPYENSRNSITGNGISIAYAENEKIKLAAMVDHLKNDFECLSILSVTP